MYGEAASVLTGSKEVYPHKIVEAGYVFKYEESNKHWKISYKYKPTDIYILLNSTIKYYHNID